MKSMNLLLGFVKLFSKLKPSSGGIGKKLNTAMEKLTIIMKKNIQLKINDTTGLVTKNIKTKYKKLETIAIAKFITIPDKLTQALSLLKFR